MALLKMLLRQWVTMGVCVQDGLQKWVCPQGQNSYLPSLKVSDRSKRNGFLLWGRGVWFCGYRVPHVERFKRKALDMDA